MADPVVQGLGEHSSDPASDRERETTADVRHLKADFDDGEVSHVEVDHVHVEERTAQPETSSAVADSLYDNPPPPTDQDDAFGRLGPPLSRRAPFYRGLHAALGVLVAVALALAVRQAATVLMLVLVAGFLAVGLNPVVELLIRHRVRRGWAVLIVALLLVTVVGGIVAIATGPLREQISRLLDDAPKLLNELRENRTIRDLDNRYHFIHALQTRLADPDFATKTFGGIYNVSVSIFTGVAETVLVFVLTLYFLAALPQVKRALFSLAPQSRRDRVGHLGDEILRRVGRYVIGAFLVALLAGTVSFVFLLSAGLSAYALPLAMLVALLDLVPLVGSILGASIVVMVGFAHSAGLGIVCVIFYVIYETIEGYVIYPRVMRSSVDVPEYLTIVAVLLGGAVAGIIGALLALPMAAAVLLLIREVWVRRQDAS